MVPGSRRAVVGLVVGACLTGCATGGSAPPTQEPLPVDQSPPAQEPPPADPPPPAQDRAAGAQPASGAPADPPVGIYSAAQAARGETAFDEVCAQCHTTSEFRGRTFRRNWGRRTVYSFFRTVRSTMPDDNPGGLDERTYLDVVSYVMRLNGHDAGPSEMSPDSPMRQVRMDPSGSGA